MALQNRVGPDGTIAAHPARGLFMGNRGRLHDGDRTLGPARWRHRGWVCCRTSFRGRRRVPMTPGRYTELFFLDEAVALAAGHRPCAECRRADHERFLDHWALAHGDRPRASELDRLLHRARAVPGARRLRSWRARTADLPDFAFVALPGGPALVLDGAALPFGFAGYDPAVPLPEGEVDVLTCAPLVRTLAAGYRPVLHPTAIK